MQPSIQSGSGQPLTPPPIGGEIPLIDVSDHLAGVSGATEKAAPSGAMPSEMSASAISYDLAGHGVPQKWIAADLQARAITYGTHVPLGQYTPPAATRSDRLSSVVTSPVPVFWNIGRKGS